MGRCARADQLLDYLLDGVDDGPPADWDVGHFVCVVARTRGLGGSLYAIADTYPSLGRGGVHLQPRERLVRALQRPGMAPGGMIVVVADADAPRCAARPAARPARVRLGQRLDDGRDGDVSTGDLVALVCCDLGAIVRGRSLLASELATNLDSGVGWVPANHALTPIGTLAEPNPFGSTGDLRLLPDPDTQVRVTAVGDHGALELVLCDIVETDGRPWECCPRAFLREGLKELRGATGLAVVASFRARVPAAREAPAALPFSLEAQRGPSRSRRRRWPPCARPGRAPSDSCPSSPRTSSRFLSRQPRASCGRPAVVLREVVREIARRNGMRATFTPLLDPAQAGNGVHIHISLLDDDQARPCTTPRARPVSARWEPASPPESSRTPTR